MTVGRDGSPSARLRAALVPILPSPIMPSPLQPSPLQPRAVPSGGEQPVSVRLHGRPLLVHATRTVLEVAPAVAVVSATASAAAAVREALTGAGLISPGAISGILVVEDGAGLGEVLTTIVMDLEASVPSCSARPGGAVLVHDPMCPLVPASYLREVLSRAEADPAAVLMATRPMTDTVKSLVDGAVQATVDRDLLRVLSSPMVAPVEVLCDLAASGRLGGCADFTDVLDLVRETGTEVSWLLAPPMGRRVSSAASVAVLECLTEVRVSDATPSRSRR